MYYISSAEELKEFANKVNDDSGEYTDIDAELTADIDLSEICGENIGGQSVSWTPIGNSISGNPYEGTFDGNGHTISGLNIDSSTADYQGLFGRVSGTVQNLSVSGSVSGNNYVGGVVGYNSGIVTNCYNTGEVSGNYVGGVVGYSSGDSSASASVTNCYNTGSVSGSYVGGVVGYSSGGFSASASVTNCYNTGTVTGSGNNVGGVVGQNRASVTNCYNIGNVSGNNYVGGVVGDNSIIGTVTGCYFLKGTAASGIGSGTGSTENVKSLTAEEFAIQSSFTNSSWDFANTWEIKSIFGRPTLQDNAEIGGTANNPYKIFTATQLAAFRDLVNRGGAGASAHAKLMDNIDLSEICSEEEGDSWTPIGTSNNPYSGTFDGNGKTISGLYIDSSDNDYKGLFGRVNGGTVQDLSVSGDINGNRYVGGVVGYNGGTVTGCIFSGSGSVSGSYSVGGVVGYNISSVTNCYNTGEVSGPDSVSGNSVGGVVGYNSSSVVGDNRGSVENCYNTDNVSGSNQIGGVVGTNGSSVENCYNTGAVNSSGSSSAAGGAVGYNISSVTNCYNTGSVTGNRVGGVVGYNSGTVENCYNIGEVSGNISGGVVGLNDSGTVKNCYNIGEVSGNSYVGGVVGLNISSGNVTGCYFLQGTAESGIGENEGTSSNVEARTDDAFHSGEVAWRLQAGQKAAGEEDPIPQVWGQSNLNTPDSWPTLVALDKDENAKPVYKVVFISDNTEIEAQYANSGMTVGSPTTNPTKEGYTFAGWFTEASGGSQWNFSTAVTKNMTLYAQWTAVEEPEPTPDPTPTPTPDPTPSGPSTGDSTGWDDILDELENTAKGDQITIDMGDETKVPAEIFESLAGKDVEISFDLGDVQWTVNGADIPTDTDFTDLDLGVNLDTHGIPVNVINTITGEVGTVQITLAHDGEFGFTMTLTAPLGKENAGYWANLYHYDESAEAMNFEAAAKIDEDGSVTIPFSHASQYAIVIDTHSHAAVDVSDLFSDIARDAWYKDAIQYAYDNGLMTGVSATEFAPEATTTRAMIVSILARLEGVTTAQAAGFADVDDNDWYATAVNWAANVGVVNGYEDNTFRPNQPITREQLAAILMNYAACIGQDVSARASLDNYTDQPSAWATETMSWAVAEGLISGVTADTLQPQGAATRAQVAAILQRFLSE